MKKCIFCHKSPPEIHFTREHILRAKLAKIITDAPKKEHWVSTNKEKGSDKFKDRAITLPQGPFDKTIKLICNECNNGWLNNSVEIPCEKYIDGLVIDNISDLDFIAKNRVSLWAAKTAAVRGLMDPEPRGLPESHYIWIKEELTPPPFTHIWLCKTFYNPDTFTRHLRNTIINNENNEHTPMHASVLNIGYMGLIILGCGSQYNEAVLDHLISSFNSFPAKKIWPSSCEHINFNAFKELHLNHLIELTDQFIFDEQQSAKRLLLARSLR